MKATQRNGYVREETREVEGSNPRAPNTGRKILHTMLQKRDLKSRKINKKRLGKASIKKVAFKI